MFFLGGTLPSSSDLPIAVSFVDLCGITRGVARTTHTHEHSAPITYTCSYFKFWGKKT